MAGVDTEGGQVEFGGRWLRRGLSGQEGFSRGYYLFVSCCFRHKLTCGMPLWRFPRGRLSTINRADCGGLLGFGFWGERGSSGISSKGDNCIYMSGVVKVLSVQGRQDDTDITDIRMGGAGLEKSADGFKERVGIIAAEIIGGVEALFAG